jgi:hypothetical protein
MFTYEALIVVAEDCRADRAIIPLIGLKKSIARIRYEVLIENPYRYSENELFQEVHYVRRNRRDLKISSYSIKRSKLCQNFGWGIHRNNDGKLALVAMDSDMYQYLKRNIKTFRSFRKKAT